MKMIFICRFWANDYEAKVTYQYYLKGLAQLKTNNWKFAFNLELVYSSEFAVFIFWNLN